MLQFGVYLKSIDRLNSPPLEGCALARGGPSNIADANHPVCLYQPPLRRRGIYTFNLKNGSPQGTPLRKLLIRGALLVLVLMPSLAHADAGYSTSTAPVITPSSSSQVIQPPAGSASPNSGLPSPSSGPSSSDKDAPKATGLDANPIQARPEIQARPAFKDRL